MAAPANKRREPNALYKAATEALAESLGWKPKDIWFWFQQLAWCIEHELTWPRACAEWLAFEHVRSIFDKRGQAAS